MLNAYWHRTGRIPGAFRSHNNQTHPRRRAAPRSRDIQEALAQALLGEGVTSEAPCPPGTCDAESAASIPVACAAPAPSRDPGESEAPTAPPWRSSPTLPAPRAPPRTALERIGPTPFSLVSNNNMYLTCGFVPFGFSCDDALTVQINALLSQMVPEYSGAALCHSCAVALDDRLRELPSAQLWSRAGAQLTAQVLGVLSSVWARMVTHAHVQWACITTMLHLLRRRGDVLALQLSLAPAHPSGAQVQDLDAKISKLVLDAVLSCSRARGGGAFRNEELQLLTLTQKLSTVVHVVMDDANAYEELLADLHDNLFWCLVRCFPYAASQDDPWHEHSKNLVRNIAQQQTAPSSAVLLETGFWARKAWAHRVLSSRQWPDKRDLQTRCLLACLLFGTERAVGGSLKEDVDSNWLTAVCRTLQTLHGMELLSTDVSNIVVELQLDWQDDERATRLFAADARGNLRLEYVRTLGSLLHGRMLAHEHTGDPVSRISSRTSLALAVDVLLDIGLGVLLDRTMWNTRGITWGLTEDGSTLARTCLSALAEIFEGASQGDWEGPLEQLALVCGHVH